VILLLASWHVAYAQRGNGDMTGQDAAQIAPAGLPVASDLTNKQDPAHYYSYLIAKITDYVESNAGEEFSFQLHVTPTAPAVKALSAQINGAGDAYKVAVQWTYVSEEKLNNATERWLLPDEFLANTPHYPSNPLKGKEVSDCEEQANTLVSLIRAEGIRPEEVRVVLGKVTFDDEETGHAWVELLTDGNWVVLDPSCGPYWDDKAEKLVRRQGFPFNYYTSHTYPVLEVHAYYNDIYYLDPRDGSGKAPVSWYEAAPAKFSCRNDVLPLLLPPLLLAEKCLRNVYGFTLYFYALFSPMAID